jgi:hypothetical protein
LLHCTPTIPGTDEEKLARLGKQTQGIHAFERHKRVMSKNGYTDAILPWPDNGCGARFEKNDGKWRTRSRAKDCVTTCREGDPVVNIEIESK